MTKTTTVDHISGNPTEVSIGDFIGFKDDVEQYGKLVKINGNWLTLSVFDGITGDRYEVQQNRSRCWKE